MALKIDFGADGLIRLTGGIDGSTDLTNIAKHPGDLRLDFGGVSAINSRGTARFLELAHALKGRKVTYFRCVTPLVDAFMTLPAMLGTKPNVAQIASLVVPYTCQRCPSVYEEELVEARELRYDGASLSFPLKSCPKCGSPMSLIETVINDYEDLVTAGALQPGS